VSLYSNCLSGSIPATVCDSAVIDVLVLDGLSSAGSCTQYIPTSLRWLIKGALRALRHVVACFLMCVCCDLFYFC
jgi:hypothetical protein